MHLVEVTKQPTCMKGACCTNNRFLWAVAVHTCWLLSNFNQSSCNTVKRTAFALAGLMLSCLCVTTTMCVEVHVHTCNVYIYVHVHKCMCVSIEYSVYDFAWNYTVATSTCTYPHCLKYIHIENSLYNF